MPLVDFVDYPNKRIYLSADTVNTSIDTLDVYREVRALRRINDNHRKFKPMIIAGGNIQKTPTTFTQSYVQLLYGCRIVPFDVSHHILLIRETFTDDDLIGHEVFDRLPLSTTTTVDVDVNVSEVEVRIVTTGSGVLPSDITAMAEAVWQQALTAYGPDTAGRTLIDARKAAANAFSISAGN